MTASKFSLSLLVLFCAGCPPTQRVEPSGEQAGPRMARAEMPVEGLKAEVPGGDDAAMERWLLSRLATARKPLAKFLPSAPAQ